MLNVRLVRLIIGVSLMLYVWLSVLRGDVASIFKIPFLAVGAYLIVYGLILLFQKIFIDSEEIPQIETGRKHEWQTTTVQVNKDDPSWGELEICYCINCGIHDLEPDPPPIYCSGQ